MQLDFPKVDFFFQSISKCYVSKAVKLLGICCSESHALAWDIAGSLFSWGDAANGKLGHLMNLNKFEMKSFEASPKKVLQL